MKKETAPENSKERLMAGSLKDNEILITVNLLRAIVKFNLIRKVDNLTIEHDSGKVNELNHNEQARHIKDSDFLLDQ